MARPIRFPALGVTTQAALPPAPLSTLAQSPAPDPIHFIGAADMGAVSKLGATPPVTTVAASGAAQNLVVPPFGGVCYDVTLTANCVFTISGWRAGVRQTLHLVLRQDGTGGRMVSLPTVKWSNGSVLTFATTALGVVDLTLTSTDGGVTIIAK